MSEIKKILLNCIFLSAILFFFPLSALADTLEIIEKININGMDYTRKTVYDGEYMSITDETLPYDVIVSVRKKVYYFVDRKNRLFDTMSNAEYDKKFGNRDVLYNIERKHFVIEQQSKEENVDGTAASLLTIMVPELRVHIDLWQKHLGYSLDDYYTCCSQFKIVGFYGNLAQHLNTDSSYPLRMKVSTNSGEIMRTDLLKISKTGNKVDVKFLQTYRQASFF